MKSNDIMGNRTALVELYGRKATNGFKLDVDEIKYITESCYGNSLSYYLVLLQQAKHITSKEELEDKAFAKSLGISERTAQRMRLSLIKAKMLSFIKKGDMTVVLLGYESVIIYEATGCDVVRVDAVKKIKRLLQIDTIKEFMESVFNIQEMYRDNPDMFNK